MTARAKTAGARVPNLLVALEQLQTRWLECAAAMEFGEHPGTAKLIRRMAEELDGVTKDAADEEVNLTTASTRCGYSVRQLSRMVEAGTLKNRGREGAPRVRVGDLPRKPGRR